MRNYFSASSRGANSLVERGGVEPCAIHEYVAHDSPSIADRIVGELVESAERLREFPLSGRLVEELKEQGVRELVVAPYRIAYDVTGETVAILKVWHGKRMLRPQEFLK